MCALSPIIVDKFYELCNEAYKTWIIHRTLFDDNSDRKKMESGDFGQVLEHVSVISLAYWLQQITKLHDPALQNNNINLTINYIIEYGGWDVSTLSVLKDSRDELNLFFKKLKPARDKFLSHNDLQAILNDSPLGGFEKDTDRMYFEKLQEFMNFVSNKTIGELRPFNDLVKTEARTFLSYLQKDLKKDAG